MATDPDADRLGVYVKDTKSGEYICLTGNMSGSFLADYEIGQKLALEGKLPEDGELIKTVVTSNLVDAMASGLEERFSAWRQPEKATICSALRKVMAA